MAENITLLADLAREFLEFAPGHLGETHMGWTIVADEHVKIVRHVELRDLIIRDSDGQHYRGTYRRDLTEYQDIEPWEDQTWATFIPVVPVRTVVTEYVTPRVAKARAEQQDGAR
ncbi:hypothetical protein [Streptosporangium sp. NPDC004631]